jgi:hypothetical protein
MMVGHTHEDMDQMFSRFSTALKFSEASVVYSVPELMKVTELSFSPTPHVVFLTEMHDWKTALDKFSTHIHWEVIQYMVIVAICNTLCHLKSRAAVYLSGRCLLSQGS